MAPDEQSGVDDAHARIAAALLGAGLDTLLIAGEPPGPLLPHLPDTLRVRPADADSEPGGDERIAALLWLDQALDDAAIDRRLGAACRRFPGRLLVWQRDGLGSDRLPPTRFFAHGFRQLLDLIDDERHHTLYEYTLADYKQAPDWLNARYWANPERFDNDDG